VTNGSESEAPPPPFQAANKRAPEIAQRQPPAPHLTDVDQRRGQQQGGDDDVGYFAPTPLGDYNEMLDRPRVPLSSKSAMVWVANSMDSTRVLDR
jgi:hypothetical protein